MSSIFFLLALLLLYSQSVRHLPEQAKKRLRKALKRVGTFISSMESLVKIIQIIMTFVKTEKAMVAGFSILLTLIANL